MTSLRDPQSFDHLPDRYDRFAELVAADLHGWLLQHLPPGGRRALDAGCGTGVHTGMLADRFDEVLAIDLSNPMLDHARRHRARPNINWQRRDLHEITAANDGRFDVVFSAYTLHHVPDLTASLHHLRSLVHPGGQLLVVDVVDERGSRPRRWLRAEAWRTFGGDLLHRRRPLGEALDLLRLQLDPDWLDHQTSDQLLPPERWRRLALSALPGVDVGSLHRARALDWHAAAAPAPHPQPGVEFRT